MIKKLLVGISFLGLSACVTPALASPYRTCSNGALVRKNQACPHPDPAPPPAPIPDPIVSPPPPPPPPPPPSPIDPLAGEIVQADNFSYPAGLEQTFYGPPPTNRGGVGALLSLTDNAAFRIDCGPGQLLKDDPMVSPNQSGVSHLHQFWGNLGADATSTYTSLRTTGGTTCGTVQAAPIDRAAYWAPAMIVATGMALKPDHILVYYKRFAATSPACTGINKRGICVDLPNGIRFITGYNMTTHHGGPADLGDFQYDYNFMGYDCYGSEDGSVPGVAGFYHTIKAVKDAGCPIGARLHVSIDSPECWDGNVSATDHRSNVSYAKGDDFGYGRQCDAQHPYLIPMMSVQLFYNTTAAFAAGDWHLSSDEMVMGVDAGTTLHMDYWEAWSPTAKTTWMTNCINAPRSCSGGDLGDGTAIIGANGPSPGPWPRQTPVAATP